MCVCVRTVFARTYLYLAEDSFDVDGQVSMWTPEATHDAKAKAF